MQDTTAGGDDVPPPPSTLVARIDVRGGIATALALALAALAILTILLAAGGYDVPRALAALWRGSFGSWYAIGSATLVRTTPLLLEVVVAQDETFDP